MTDQEKWDQITPSIQTRADELAFHKAQDQILENRINVKKASIPKSNNHGCIVGVGYLLSFFLPWLGFFWSILLILLGKPGHGICCLILSGIFAVIQFFLGTLISVIFALI